MSKVCRDLLTPRETLASKNGKATKSREKRGNERTKTLLNPGTVIAPPMLNNHHSAYPQNGLKV